MFKMTGQISSDNLQNMTILDQTAKHQKITGPRASQYKPNGPSEKFEKARLERQQLRSRITADNFIKGCDSGRGNQDVTTPGLRSIPMSPS